MLLSVFAFQTPGHKTHGQRLFQTTDMHNHVPPEKMSYQLAGQLKDAARETE